VCGLTSALLKREFPLFRGNAVTALNQSYAMTEASPPARRVLVVEDEPLISMLLVEMLAELGCAVVGPAFSIAEARRLAAIAKVDAALLDIKVRDEFSGEVADILADRGIPFLFVTGYGCAPDGAHSKVAVLKKPFDATGLRGAINALGRVNGTSL
jgi:CheY-like chemotaxis protein